MIVTNLEQLRMPCEPVTTLSEGLAIGRRLVHALRVVNKRASRPLTATEAKYGHSRQKGVGLSANQIGIQKRVAVILTSSVPLLLMNPVIIARSPLEITIEEGCLSLPGVKAMVRRSPWVEVSCFNWESPRLFGTKDPLKWTGDVLLRCVVVQHEIDHVNGRIFNEK